MDGGAMLAHAKAVSAPRAWAWKNVIPTTPETDLSDEHYRIADRLSLRLPPIRGMKALPDDCPLCNKTGRHSAGSVGTFSPASRLAGTGGDVGDTMRSSTYCTAQH